MHRLYALLFLLGMGGLGFGVVQLAAQTVMPAPILLEEKPIADSTSQDVKTKAEPIPAPKDLSIPQIDLTPQTTSVDSKPLTIPTVQPNPTPSPSLEIPPLPPIEIETRKQELTPKQESNPVPNLDLPAPIKEAASTTEPQKVETAPKMDEVPLPKNETPSVPNMEMVPVPVTEPNSSLPAKTPTPPKGVAPSLHVEVVAPESVVIGQQLNYEIILKNMGPTTVHQVKLEDDLTKTMKYLGGNPVGEVKGERISWMLGTIEVGGEKRIQVALKPMTDGDWRSCPTITFTTQTLPIQVKVTKPKLALKIHAPSEARYQGEEIPFEIEISNSGTGPAKGIRLRAKLAEGLNHSQGQLIDAELSNLAVGETKKVTLKATATKTGQPEIQVAAVTDGIEEIASEASVQILPPTLQLRLIGPPKGFVKSEPIFTLELANLSTTTTEPIQVAAALPEGMEFVSTTEGGKFDADARVVRWSLGGLLTGTKTNLTIKARCNAVGNCAVRAVANAGGRLEIKAESVITIDGVPALTFEVINLDNPVEVGKEAHYEIRVTNQGTLTATNLRLAAGFSEGIVPTNVSGPVGYKIHGQILTFDAIAKLAPKADVVIRVKAKSSQPGDLRCKVQMICDQLKQPIVKEESTMVYQP